MKHMKPLKAQQGMLLLEGLIAILIFSCGILALVGLQSATVRYVGDAKYRADASFLANQSIGKMWADRQNLSAYVVTDETLSSLPSGKRTITVTGTTVKVTITWQSPGEGSGHNYVVVTQING
jgi:type IV pilus assembly protein PilV